MDITRMELVLMRHGSTLWNEQKRYLGHTDLSLSLQGREEMISARRNLKGMSFCSVYCSDLARCRESLHAVRPDLSAGAIYDSALREMNFGDWEGHTYDQLKDVALYRQWLDDPQHITPPEGEAWVSFERRIAAFLDSMLYSAEGGKKRKSASPTSVLLVAHGGVIRQIVSLLMPGKGFWDIRVEPGNLLILTMEHRGESWVGVDLRMI
ncbi:histidine phosphatase family protein [Paenibacillus dokdonensis]|uniref:Histidine phosphatase family protein n=1 Tax=Paenibacillus dokdonensis TaxID=2567944 RepID=A0ABU6GJJ2_9BACL|nr:histidine phosphatase family protein [Paenibacillus dokdonensis]MEC0238406.1 histidine phosphatase family protein [Paenibacillus dokdonensis]